tara:strand:- start:14 stop:574 length:561 start_codon:yes stop_codon:yes gene_type:complete
MDRAKTHIITHFKDIKDEAYGRLKGLKYYSGSSWGADGKGNYNMPNNEFFKYWVKGWNNSDKWLSHLLSAGENSEMVNSNSKTLEILKEAGDIMNKKLIMAGYAMLRPGGVIDVHQDETESRGWKNVWHLGLFVEDGCSLIISDGKPEPTVYEEMDGKLLAFDDSNFHGAINNGSKDRVILYIKWI